MQALKIIKTETKDGIMFERKGAEYAKALYKNDNAALSSLLMELFKESSLKEVISYIELNGGSNELTYDSVFSHIRTMARIKENPKYPSGVSDPYKAGITAMIDLLVRASILPQEIVANKKENAKKDSLKTGQSRRQKVIEHKNGENAEKALSNRHSQIGKDGKADAAGNIPGLPFVLNINIEVKDAESIKQLINFIKELKEQLQPTTLRD